MSAWLLQPMAAAATHKKDTRKDAPANKAGAAYTRSTSMPPVHKLPPPQHQKLHAALLLLLLLFKLAAAAGQQVEPSMKHQEPHNTAHFPTDFTTSTTTTVQ
jgi:hypothetical protein